MHVSAIVDILRGYRGTYIWGVCTLRPRGRGGYVLCGMYFAGGGGYVHCGRQQISVKNEEVLIFGGVLIYGVLR